jgi:glycosyltransferase involved in cell wall biosynthesis
VVAGSPQGDQGTRGDAADAPWIRYVEPRSVPIGRRRVNLGGSKTAWNKADAVIVGLIGTSVDTYAAVLSGIRDEVRVGLWGHVKSYTASPNRVDLALERWQMRHAHQIFAYTPSGADAAVAAGIPRSRVTTIMNSIDTDALCAAVADLNEEKVSEFMRHYDLRPGRTVAILGGLDASKRIEFLAAALEELHRLAPDIKILLAGKGSQADLLQSAIERGQVINLGYVGDTEKALLGRTVSAFVNPGRVGLLAVEALLLRVPIVTTGWPFHAPEVEYLIEGVSKFTAPNTPSEFARYVSDFCEEPRRDEGIELEFPTLDAMVENFRTGVVSMMRDSPKAR